MHCAVLGVLICLARRAQSISMRSLMQMRHSCRSDRGFSSLLARRQHVTDAHYCSCAGVVGAELEHDGHDDWRSVR